MKIYLFSPPRVALTSMVMFAFVASSAQAQQVFTKPSGFVRLRAAAATSASSPSFSFVNHALAQKRKSVGEVTTGGADEITSSASSWGIDDFAGSNGPHFVLITSGTQEGDLYNIESNTADTLTLEAGSGDASALVGESFRIYQHNTLESLFGEDPTTGGFQGGLDAEGADQVVIHDGADFITYFYKNVDIPDFLDANDVPEGWVSANDNTTEVGDLIIAPNQGFIILRRSSASDYEVTVFGDVIDQSINVPIVEGFNLISVPYPLEGQVTLDSSGLFDAADTGFLTSLQPGLDANSSELVVTWNGTSYEQYYYKNQNIPDFLDPNDLPEGWVSSADNTVDQGATPLDGGFFIQRKAPNPPLNWVFPSVVSP